MSNRAPSLVLHLIAMPLFIIGALLVLSGLFELDAGEIAVGVIGLIAGMVLQRHGHHLEAEQPQPFSHRRH